MKRELAWTMGTAALLISTLSDQGWAAAICVRPEDAAAVHTAAVQQEMMVAALTCHDASSYNRFVLSHQHELQESDKALMNFFLQGDADTGEASYDLYKTELANASSLRAVRDRQFCRRANANLKVVQDGDQQLAQLLTKLPYPVETGSVRCASDGVVSVVADDSVSTRSATRTPQRPVRHRTWLGRLVDAIFN
ncbi:MAG: hypothetical protein WCA81_15220 [Rhizomicrobium sp.]